MKKNVFEKIREPLQPLSNETVRSSSVDSRKYKLSFGAFSINLICGIICQAKSMAGLTAEIETSPAARELGLVVASRSMYSESFRRYRPDFFRRMFAKLPSSRNFLEIPEIRSPGRILLIDGSLFPAVSTMAWAKCEEGANALKMHLSFELDRMVPVHFLRAEGNCSEKAFLRGIVEKGATYVCDRGYVSFETLKRIGKAGALFVIRSKCNLLYDTIESMAVEIPERLSKFFDGIEDTIVAFRNDPAQVPCRVVTFASLGESCILTTNRYDLSTCQIVMLYAYRRQIELHFRFFKRTPNGIRL